MISDWLAQTLRFRRVRAVRGATTVPYNSSAEIHLATLELLEEMQRRNAITQQRVISVIFTMTPDLTAAFPAEAVRLAGWQEVPLLCTSEVAVPGGLPRCLRILLHAECAWSAVPVPVYLRHAVQLRPDLACVTTTAEGVAFPVETRQHPPRQERRYPTHSH